ncbi:MAG: ABC transporter ATP-binding protein [Alphaproteobacteria bacterium]|jgi:lipoprotein-releasing system ATP-binding protein|nr:ABC transporter ATP-binding protein [Alphaproteobacteria bacterium]MBT4016412.1 ABC transporter ATP-binding protein [Alphaproteobacteria bacterium]MBT4965402.1 ABC transporter ATP-binding protein [Alphaproteobacteria bacterium]MBT5160313.1 ABC transporter ATP-binding protein [Alphaproteobacteria bacterium]MBT5918422.1 ABC transporter ATP-binding protein [Alphaproteobacteria bacterium]
MSEAALVLDGIERTFKQGGADIRVLKGAQLSIQPGEFVALLGPSGSGKSTLLQIAGLLERADGGDVLLSGTSCNKLSERNRTATRRDKLGFVYQHHHLLPEFTALENVMMPQMIAGKSKAAAKQRATDLLGRFGLDHRLSHRPAKLSGGEQQRVSIARAIANQPAVLLADEPTGNLDTHTADDVLKELLQLIRSQKLAALVATHNADLAAQADRVVRLEDGVLVSG